MGRVWGQTKVFLYNFLYYLLFGGIKMSTYYFCKKIVYFFKESGEGKITDSGLQSGKYHSRRTGPARTHVPGNEIRCLLASLIAPDFGCCLDLSRPRPDLRGV